MGSDELATALKEYESEYGLSLKKILILAILPPCILLVVAVVPPFEISIFVLMMQMLIWMFPSVLMLIIDLLRIRQNNQHINQTNMISILEKGRKLTVLGSVAHSLLDKNGGIRLIEFAFLNDYYASVMLEQRKMRISQLRAHIETA